VGGGEGIRRGRVRTGDGGGEKEGCKALM